ncbi:MAG: thioredoxin family protein [Chitinivibrionales bacterium]
MKPTTVLISVLFFAGAIFAENADAQKSKVQDKSQAIADEIVKSEIPVLVDFWASWCKPCFMLDPTIKEIRKRYEGRLLVKKVNVDVHRKIAAYFKVNSIPAVYIIKNKTVVKFIPGVQPENVYFAAIDEVLGKASASKDPVQSN